MARISKRVREEAVMMLMHDFGAMSRLTFWDADDDGDVYADRQGPCPASRLAGEAWGEQAFRDATPDSVICPECGSPLTRREYGEEWWHDTPATDGEEPLSGSR